MATPELITLAQAKAFLRVEHDDHDELIESLVLTATENALELANGLDADDLAMSPPVVPERVRTAIQIHVLALYGKPSAPDLPAAATALLQPFRAYLGDSDGDA